MPAHTLTAALALALLGLARADAPEKTPDLSGCEVAARTRAGWVCGQLRQDSADAKYASFRGVPYARQPLGELRFQELQPLEPWEDVFNATSEGPVCPQTDVFYGRLQSAKGGMGEACIHANIHVPRAALPSVLDKDFETTTTRVETGLPILVFVHGGGWSFGSGDADLHGPEYLVSKGVIVITFNYRLNVFGFLSLNSSQIPGNAGLRDVVTLLCWVRDNARAFGGDPNRVTLAGQSAGASITHMLSLSTAAAGLFDKVILMSGTGFSEFLSTSPAYAKTVADLFLVKMGINPWLPAEDIHKQLVEAPLEKIMEAQTELINTFGLTTFVPVVESSFPGVTTILDDDPEVLTNKGRSSDIPTMIGFTDVECESFRNRFEEIDITSQIEKMPALAVPIRLLYQTPPLTVPLITKVIHNRYFNDTVDMDSFVNLCTDGYYKYAALKLAEKRVHDKTPTFLYRFSYGGQHSPLKKAFRLNFPGAGHVEDLTYIFRVNSILKPVVSSELYQIDSDGIIKNRMTDFFVSFMLYGYPITNPVSSWPPQSWPTVYQDVCWPYQLQLTRPTAEETALKDFFDGLYKISRGV